MINTFLLNIKVGDWNKLSETSYTFTKSLNVYNTNVAIHCYDKSGNSLNVGIKIEYQGEVTFTHDKAEEMDVVFFIPDGVEQIGSSIINSNFPTSTYLNEDKGWIEQAYKNEKGEPVVADRIENHIISPINSAVQLTEIPDKYYGIEFKLKDSNINLKRLYNIDEIANSTNSYYIGENNMIYCSTNLIGKLVEVSYKGMGKTIINCNMIYYRDAINSVPKILEDLIDEGYKAIEAITTLGDAVIIIKTLKEDIDIGNKLHTTLSSDFTVGNKLHSTLSNDFVTGNALHKTLTNDITTGNKLHETLTADNAEANRIQPILHQDNVEANRIQPILHQDIIDANTFVTNHGDIIDLDKRVDGIENDKLTSLETDISLTKLNSVVDGNVIVDRIQGKTLANLIKPTALNTGATAYSLQGVVTQLKSFSTKTMTLINNTDKRVGVDIEENTTYKRSVYVEKKSSSVINLTVDENVQLIYGLFKDGWTDENKNVLLKIMILDGAYTGSMPSYFEGMKSVGEDNQNKVEISTCGKNLWNPSTTILNTTLKWADGLITTEDGSVTSDFIKIQPGSRIYLKYFGTNTTYSFQTIEYDIDKNIVFPDTQNTSEITSLSSNTHYIRVSRRKNDNRTDNIMLALSPITEYTPYYGDESEISLSAPLREFDYINKDGVHRFSINKVIDENTPNMYVQSTNSYDIINFYYATSAIILDVICYPLPFKNTPIADTKEEGWTYNNKNILFRIKCTTIGCQASDSDSVKLQKFKTWLQAKKTAGTPLTVVYTVGDETIEPLNKTLILSSFKDGYFGISAGAINPVVSLSFPTTIGGRVDSLEESNYQLKKDYYSTLKTLIKCADDCLKLELNKQNKTDNSLVTTSKEIVGSINELNTNKVEKVSGKGLSTNDFTTPLLNKLNGIAEKANNYVHPNTHSATMITQDTTHRFITDAEKNSVFNPSKNLSLSGGYIKLANGLILQWGMATSGNPAEWIAFPVSYPNGTLTLQFTSVQGNNEVTVNGQNGSGFEALSPSGTDFYWFSIGN